MKVYLISRYSSWDNMFVPIIIFSSLKRVEKFLKDKDTRQYIFEEWVINKE